MKRTTIFADEELLNAIKKIAIEKEVSIAEVIREALEKFIAQYQNSKKSLSFIGIGRSGKKDISEKFEDLLWKKSIREIEAKI